MSVNKQSDQDSVKARIRLADPLFMLQNEKGIKYYSVMQEELATFDFRKPTYKVPRSTFEKVGEILKSRMQTHTGVSQEEFDFHQNNLSILADLPNYVESNLDLFEPWINDAKLIEVFREKEKIGGFDRLTVTSPKGEKFIIEDEELVSQLFSTRNLTDRFKLINSFLEANEVNMAKARKDRLQKTGEDIDINSSTLVRNVIGSLRKRRDVFINALAVYIEIYKLVETTSDDLPVRNHQIGFISNLLEASGFLSEDRYESPIKQIVRNGLFTDPLEFIQSSTKNT